MSRFSPLLLTGALTGGMTAPDLMRLETAELAKRKEVMGRLKLETPVFPEGEDWLCKPEYTSRKMDIHVWTHRCGAEFNERTMFPWMKDIVTVYEVNAPFFMRSPPRGCRVCEKYYDWSWITYMFDEFDDAAAFTLEVRSRLDRGDFASDAKSEELPVDGQTYRYSERDKNYEKA